jgi:type I restriction enzyme S subunit
MGEWKEVELSAIADVQTGPFGSQLHASDYVPVGVPVIMPNNIGQRLTLNEANMNYITEADATRLARYKVRENDIVFSRRGDVDKCILIDARKAGWFCGTGCLFARLNSKVIDPTFVAYQFDSPELKNWLRTNAVGTTMPNLNSKILERAPVALPDLPEQRAIASVLSSLDAKIDLLHRQNKTLEGMAEALFRQWFVEEAEENAAEGTLADVAVNIRDGVPVNAFNVDDRYVALEHIDRRRIALLQYGSSADVASNKYRFQANDILFGKLRPYFHKVCLTSFAGICSTDILVIRPKRPELLYYCLFAFFQDEVVEYANAGSGGTRMPRTSWSDLSKYPIALPGKERLEAFNKVVKPMIEKLQANIPQIQSLTALRDTLLPKLMSGEVRVEGEVLV